LLTIAALGNAFLAAGLRAQPSAADDLAQFERKAALEKELGATHVVITEGLPLATWEFDATDPYPAWYMHHASLLKVFPPKDVQPYVNMEYAAKVAAILEKRCEILRKYGLKGVWNANEPAVMPEAFFTAHPELRGPRIDQPNRSTRAHFAPSVDEPETLRLYRESMQLLLKHCPEVELFNWVTTDAGSGFDWTPSLYPGIKSEANPVLGVQSGWDRTDLMETARKEIDNMVNLKRLLDSANEPILDLAPTPAGETIMRLGPNVAAQLKHKIDVMNAHWRDYDRLFTAPNP
jgi:hypothetical protein